MTHNAKQLVSQMTLEEKANFCSGVDNWHLYSLPRLNIPEIMVCDGPHGLRKQDETCDISSVNSSIPAICFPNACATSCCFNTELLEEMGRTIGDEVLHEKVGIILGPACNIKRSPICGRNFEYYSEDPLISSKCEGSIIKGIQSRNIGACVKHFACNNQETLRLSINETIDERALREIYLAAFEGAVREAKPWTVMCSYNKINGEFCSQNEWLLEKVLRGDWGFEGFVMSDWGAVADRVLGCKAGLELQMPGPATWHNEQIVKAVKEGIMDESILNRCAERVVNIILKSSDGIKNGKGSFDKEAHHKIARKIGEECMVLLKNEHSILPLKKEQKVAFIGPYAKNPRYQGGGSSHINAFKVTNALDSAKLISQNICYAEGCKDETDEVDEKLLHEAVEVARVVDVAVCFIGLPDSFECEGYDREHIHLPKCQNELVSEVSRVNPNTVVVLHNGSPVDMPWLNHVKGVLEAYLGGQAVGEVTADILYGIVNPSGHLAETFPLKLEDNPSTIDFGGHQDNVNYREGIYVGYRYYDLKKMDVLFPFGHGLSYTAFSYKNLRFDKDEFKDNETVFAHVDVTNIGPVEGKACVQLYVADKTGYEYRPPKELRAYKKVSLKPGETKTVDLELNKRSFAFWNTEIHEWYVPTGEFEILIGESSRHIDLVGKVHVESTRVIERPITAQTPFEDIYNNPVTRPAIEKVLEKYPEEKKLLESTDAAHEFWRQQANTTPIRSSTNFFPWNGGVVLDIIADANKLLEAHKKK